MIPYLKVDYNYNFGNPEATPKAFNYASSSWSPKG